MQGAGVGGLLGRKWSAAVRGREWLGVLND